MGYKVTKKEIPRDLITQVRKEFSANASNANAIKKKILEDLAAGVSPVEGQKWTKYSNSYKDVIRGKKTFRKTKTGKTVVFNQPDEAFLRNGKSIAPVNLKLTGGLWKSLSVTTGMLRLTIAFKDFLAQVHNNLGASKKKVIRRLLPTESGEKLNEGIMQVVIERLKNAVDNVVKRVNRQ
jgi:hypothetical protein